jgi:hypothetical protein
MEKQSKTLKLSESFPALAKYCPHDPSLNPRQAAFLWLPNREAFYGGAAGGGKSDAVLAGALQYADVPGYAAILFRRTYTDLSLPGAIMARSEEWLRGSDATWSHERKTWTFPSGATVSFGYLDNDSDVYRYQSAEFQYVGFDELTQFTEKQYTYLFSRLRRLKDFAVPLRMRSASNPGGIGHTWVKRRFVDERAPGVVFIPAGVKDSSAYLDVNAYVQSLSELSPTLRQQLLEGDWGAFEGAAFQDFNRALHCIPRIQIEDFWERFESMDYGISNPTAWLFWVVDGEGNLIVTDSHYAPGLPSETAPIIVKKRQLWRSTECFGDPASLAQRTSTVNRFGEASTIESEFADLGVPLARAHNDPRAGYTRLRELIKPDPKHRFPDWHPFRGRTGSPHLFIVAQGCPQLVEQFETAPLQGEDKQWTGEMVDPKWESAHGHALAACRYGAMSRPQVPVEPERPPSNPEWSDDQTARAEWFWEHNKRRDGRDNEIRDYDLV